MFARFPTEALGAAFAHRACDGFASEQEQPDVPLPRFGVEALLAGFDKPDNRSIGTAFYASISLSNLTGCEGQICTRFEMMPGKLIDRSLFDQWNVPPDQEDIFRIGLPGTGDCRSLQRG